LPLGVAYALGTASTGPSLFRIETRVEPGRGLVALTWPEVVEKRDQVQESLEIARDCFFRHLPQLGIDRPWTEFDLRVAFHADRADPEPTIPALGFFLSMVLAVQSRSADPTAAVIGLMKRNGSVERVPDLHLRMQFAHEAGIKRVLLPIDSKVQLAGVADSILLNLNVAWFGDALGAARAVLH
jgi:predicted ATP-dependent Lon-type protease